jgi:hypothetical protein
MRPAVLPGQNWSEDIREKEAGYGYKKASGLLPGERKMARVEKVHQVTHNRFLNFYELETVKRTGKAGTYYLASRAESESGLEILTHENHPDGVVIFSLYGEKETGSSWSTSSVIRSEPMYMSFRPDWSRRARITAGLRSGRCGKRPVSASGRLMWILFLNGLFTRP